jgi:hypothetical protein
LTCLLRKIIRAEITITFNTKCEWTIKKDHKKFSSCRGGKTNMHHLEGLFYNLSSWPRNHHHRKEIKVC